jgi:hypothetical protein
MFRNRDSIGVLLFKRLEELQQLHDFNTFNFGDDLRMGVFLGHSNVPAFERQANRFGSF